MGLKHSSLVQYNLSILVFLYNVYVNVCLYMKALLQVCGKFNVLQMSHTTLIALKWENFVTTFVVAHSSTVNI